MRGPASSFFLLLLCALFLSGCICGIPVVKASPVAKGTTAQVIGKGKFGGALGVEAAFDASNGIGMKSGAKGVEIAAHPVKDVDEYRSYLISGDMILGITKSTDIEAGVLYAPILSLGGRIGVKQRLFPLGKEGAVAVFPRVSYIWAYEEATVIFPVFFTDATTVAVDQKNRYYTTSVDVPLIFTVPLAPILSLSAGPQITFRNLRYDVRYSENYNGTRPSVSGSGSRDFTFVQPGAFLGLTLGGRGFQATIEMTWLRTKDQADDTWHDVFFPGLGMQFGGGAPPPEAEERRAAL